MTPDFKIFAIKPHTFKENEVLYNIKEKLIESKKTYHIAEFQDFNEAMFAVSFFKNKHNGSFPVIFDHDTNLIGSLDELVEYLTKP